MWGILLFKDLYCYYNVLFISLSNNLGEKLLVDIVKMIVKKLLREQNYRDRTNCRVIEKNQNFEGELQVILRVMIFK